MKFTPVTPISGRCLLSLPWFTPLNIIKNLIVFRVIKMRLFCVFSHRRLHKEKIIGASFPRTRFVCDFHCSRRRSTFSCNRHSKLISFPRNGTGIHATIVAVVVVVVVIDDTNQTITKGSKNQQTHANVIQSSSFARRSHVCVFRRHRCRQLISICINFIATQRID